MAKGFPDYFGVSTFHRYGAFMSTPGNLAFNPFLADADLFDINVKGQIYGGNIWFTSAVEIQNVTIEMVIDGNASQVWSLRNRYEHGFYRPQEDSFYLTQYDIDTNQHVLGISPGITFDNSIRVTIYNIGLLVFAVTGYLTYSIVRD